MKRHITWIIVLMGVTVAGIIGLQLFWNFVNYQTTVRNFDHDTNEALRAATDREFDKRQRAVASQVGLWMNDTSRILITCDTNSRQHETVFHVKDAHPYNPKETGISLSINHYSPRIAAITPEVKQHFIRHFTENIVLPDLQKGVIYYYTQRMGDSLQRLFFNSRLDTGLLRSLYTEELARRGNHSPFTLDPVDVRRFQWQTQAVNTSLRRPYEKAMVTAGFDSPDFYFLRKMKWVIITTPAPGVRIHRPGSVDPGGTG
jgi:two-component system phosphate regulon sensor histidine kinase PhoR